MVGVFPSWLIVVIMDLRYGWIIAVMDYCCHDYWREIQSLLSFAAFFFAPREVSTVSIEVHVDVCKHHAEMFVYNCVYRIYK